MKVKPRSLLVVLLIVFVVYAIIVSPQTAADYVRAVFVFIADAVRSIFTFFDALMNR
jgi:hypothetical protein